MNTNFDNLRSFFERIKSITLWQRIFSWSSLRSLSYDAYEEFKSVSDTLDSLNRQIIEKEDKIGQQDKNIQIISARISDLNASNLELKNKITGLEFELDKLSTANADMSKKITRFEQTEQTRLDEYQKNVSGVNALRESLEKERQKMIDERVKEEEDRNERMKQTWRNHENMVKERLKNICLQKQVEYIDKVDFKGNPDNTVKIAGEYIIFDAKSPAGDDLENFPKYLKLQTENVKKYTKQKDVKSDIFLVVPSNTLDRIPQFNYNMGEYNAYIITVESLDPIVSFLKKIEEYNIITDLSPEERDNICRIIGRFSHTAKRKIQIDHFFSYQFLEILSKCNIDLPPEIFEKVEEFEKAEKLNPTQEKRNRQILMEELISQTERIAIEARARITDAGENEKKTEK